MTPSWIPTLLLLTTAFGNRLENTKREDSCTPCNPQHATGTVLPTVGPELSSLYTDVLQSVKDIHFRKRWADSIISRADAFCCHETVDCVNVLNLNIAMCYDKFTTQYAFQGGSWGSLTTGEYNSPDGGKANLLNGTFTKVGGEEGSIYAGDPGAKPNTATMSIPPQWTGTGVGSAIPPTEIASFVTNAPAQSTTESLTAAMTTEINTLAPPSPESTSGAVKVGMVSKALFGNLVLIALMYGP